jgi:hypothetical protein
MHEALAPALGEIGLPSNSSRAQGCGHARGGGASRRPCAACWPGVTHGPRTGRPSAAPAAQEDDAAFWNRLVPAAERPEDEDAAALGVRAARLRAADEVRARRPAPVSEVMRYKLPHYAASMAQTAAGGAL